MDDIRQSQDYADQHKKLIFLQFPIRISGVDVFMKYTVPLLIGSIPGEMKTLCV